LDANLYADFGEEILSHTFDVVMWITNTFWTRLRVRGFDDGSSGAVIPNGKPAAWWMRNRAMTKEDQSDTIF